MLAGYSSHQTQPQERRKLGCVEGEHHFEKPTLGCKTFDRLFKKTAQVFLFSKAL
jgi:hypothetical protein